MLQRYLLQMADALADLLTPSPGPLSADQLIAVARRRTGLQEFGETPFMDPLLRFLRACFEEAELSLVGRIATRWDVVRFLSNLLLLREEERKAPAILDQAITRPIFVSGLPRSGTTFLHSLLAEDPANLVPQVWQLIHPYVDRKGGHRPDMVIRRVGEATAAVRPLGSRVPPNAPDRRQFAAGVLGDHRPCFRQLALRFDLPHSELSALAR